MEKKQPEDGLPTVAISRGLPRVTKNPSNDVPYLNRTEKFSFD